MAEMSRGERWLTAAVVLVMLAAGGADLLLGAPEGPGREVEPGPFLSNGWYCPAPPGEITSVVSTTNPGDGALRVRRRTFGASAESEPRQTVVEAHRRASVNVGDFGLGSATLFVETFGRDSASDTIAYAGGVGVSSPRCTVQPSDLWYFSSASTSRGRDTRLLISNPFDEEAVIEVRVITPKEDFVPGLLKDLVIRPLSQESIFLPNFVLTPRSLARGEEEEVPRFGFVVRATRGRVVAARYQVITSGTKSMRVDLGIQSTGVEWFFPGGEIPTDGVEKLIMINPSDQEALVRIVVITKEEVRSLASLEQVAVPAGRQVTVDMADHLERGLVYAARVTSINDVPIAVERETEGRFPQGSGVDGAIPVSEPAPRWVLSVGSPVGGTEVTSIVNFGAVPAVVRISLLFEDRREQPEELSGLRIDPGRKITVDLTPFLGDKAATAVIEAVIGQIGVESRTYIGGRVDDFADSSARS